MIVLTWLAWAATAVCLYTYVRMQRGHSPAVFDWANAIGCIPLVLMDYLVGATPAAVISLAFGIAGAHGRIAAWRERRTLNRWVDGLPVRGWGHDLIILEDTPSNIDRKDAWDWYRSVYLHRAGQEERGVDGEG